MKKVSVIVPAFNKVGLTVKTVESILNQDYKNIEVIVVDDGSTDNTRTKLQLFGDKIRYYYKDNGGACSARNFGILKASGDYIALIDCDDIYYPEKISKSVDMLELNPDIGLVHTGVKLIDNHDNIVGYHSFPVNQVEGWIAQRLILQNLVSNPTVVIRRECFDKVGLFDESVFIPADWDMWLRLSEEFKFGYIEEPLSGYRITGNYTISHLELNLKEEIYVLEKTIKRGGFAISNKLKKKCYAILYYRVGLLYGAIGDGIQSREFLRKAAMFDYKNLKVVIHYLASIFFPWILRAIMKKRYYIQYMTHFKSSS